MQYNFAYYYKLSQESRFFPFFIKSKSRGFSLRAKPFKVKSEHTARGHAPEKTPSLKTTTGLFLTSSDHISIKAEQTQPATGERAVSSARPHNRSRGDGGDLLDTKNKKHHRTEQIREHLTGTAWSVFGDGNLTSSLVIRSISLLRE